MVSSSVLIHAPVRIDFCGGFTDVPEVARSLGTTVVNAAVDLYHDAEHTHAVDFAVELHPKRPAAPNAMDASESLLASLTDYLGQDIDARRDLRIHRALPLSTGLGSSGALSVMLIAAWLVSRHRPWRHAPSVAAKARDFECRFLGLKGGYQDYFSAASGGYHCFAEEAQDLGPRIRRSPLPTRFAHLVDHATFVVVAPRPCPSTSIISDMVGRLASDSSLQQRLRGIKACNEAFAGAVLAEDLGAAMKIVGEAAELRHGISPYALNSTLDTIREQLRPFCRAAHECGAGGGAIVVYAWERSLNALRQRLPGLEHDFGVKIFFPKHNRCGLRVISRTL